MPKNLSNPDNKNLYRDTLFFLSKHIVTQMNKSKTFWVVLSAILWGTLIIQLYWLATGQLEAGHNHISTSTLGIVTLQLRKRIVKYSDFIETRNLKEEWQRYSESNR